MTAPPLLAFVDDDAFIREAWESAFGAAATVRAFASPQALLAAVAADPGLLGRLAGVVTDQWFAPGDATGLELAAELRRRRGDLPVFLASDGEFTAGELAGVAGRLDKVPPSWPELAALLGR